MKLSKKLAVILSVVMFSSILSAVNFTNFQNSCATFRINDVELYLDVCSDESNDQNSFLSSLKEVFASKHTLSTLTISNTYLPNDFLNSICHIKTLQILNLSNNRITHLPKSCFHRLKNIEVIRITFNLFERLEDGIFDGLLKLKELVLTNNKINYIGARIFSNMTSLPNLMLIRLVANNLTSIGVWPFIRGISLNFATVDVGSNYIKKFTNELNWHYNCSMRKKHGYNFNYILNGNEIEHLHDFFSPVFKNDVDIFCLRGNKFVTNVSIQLDDNNPFKCDCIDSNYLNKLSILTTANFMTRARCVEPHYNKRWILLEQNDMKCPQIIDGSCIKDCECFKIGKRFYEVKCHSFNTLPKNLPLRNLTTKYNSPYKLSFTDSNIAVVDHRDYFKDVKMLNLSKSRLEVITKEALTSILSISEVFLNDNELKMLPRVNTTIKTKRLSLHNNSWDCTCNNVGLKHWLQDLKDKNILVDFESIYCHSPTWLKHRNILKIKDEECQNPKIAIVKTVLLSVLIPAVSLVIILIVIYQLVKKFKVHLHTYMNIHLLDRDECNGENMEFDGFISSSYQDRLFAIELTKWLESNGYRICYHEKDFIGGVPIAANIQHAIEASKRTIFLLSHHFLPSHYCMYEFQTALARNSRLKKNRMIALIVDRQFVRNPALPAEMDLYLNTHTYIEVDNFTKFKNQLLYSMPLKKMGPSVICG